MMCIGYADPPYPGYSRFYKDHPDYVGELDYAELIKRLETDFDGWVLHAASVNISQIAPLMPSVARWMAWVKPFASFKKNIAVAYAWEPVIVKCARKRVYDGWTTQRDWLACPITLKRGLVGAKPEAVCHWLFEVVGAERDDNLIDLFPGSGAVTRAWETWSKQPLLMESATEKALL